MYCSQCGKKVMDTMLFCPFCGSPIVIPEQEEKAQAAVGVTHAEGAKIGISSESIFDEKAPAALPEKEEAESEFVPLDMNQVWNEPSAKEIKNADVEQEVSETLSRQLQEEQVRPQKESIRLQGRKPDLSAARPHSAPKIASRKSSETFVPQRKFNPDDIFFDGGKDEDYEDDYEYEESEHGSFFIRHIRGFVSLIMFAIVAAVVLGWAFSTSGQQALARAGLAWRPEVYAEVAFEAYQNGSYALAGKYYGEALERDDGSYEYANSAGVAFYMANDTLNAEAMAKKAVEINPVRMDAYELLLRLYPNADSRPLEIQAIFQKGYQLNGSENLNPGQ